MKLNNLITYLAILCIATYSCKKIDQSSALHQEHIDMVVGDYEWIHTFVSHTQYCMPTAVYYYPATDTARAAFSIDQAATMRIFSNGVLKEQFTIKSTSLDENKVTLEGTDAKGKVFQVIINGEDGQYGHHPYNGINKYKKVANTASIGTFVHTTPNCGPIPEICGSYTGYELIKFVPYTPSWATSDTLSYELKTILLVPGSPLNCNLVTVDDSVIRNFYSTENSKKYVDGDYLYLRDYWQPYKCAPLKEWYTFIGLKDE